MVAFSGFYETHKPPPSGDVRGIVLAHHHVHQNGEQSWHILHRCFVFCRPGGQWGDTERVVSQCRRLFAFMKALDLLYWMMRSILLQCVRVAIEIAQDGGTFDCHRHLFWPKTMLWSININSKLDYCFLLCYRLVCTLLASANDNGHCFGYHCRRGTSTNFRT